MPALAMKSTNNMRMVMALQVMSNEEVADCIRELKSGQEAAQVLIEEALLRGSKDDISCIVVKLD